MKFIMRKSCGAKGADGRRGFLKSFFNQLTVKAVSFLISCVLGSSTLGTNAFASPALKAESKDHAELTDQAPILQPEPQAEKAAKIESSKSPVKAPPRNDLSEASGTSTLQAASPLSWAQIVDIAIKNNPELAAAQSDLRAARAQLNGTYSSFLPQLSSNVGYSYGGVGQNDLLRGQGAGLEGYSVSLKLEQSLFSGFQDQARITQSEASLSQWASALVSTTARASYDLKSAYTGLIYTQSLVQLTDDIRARRENNFRLVQLRFESGRENKGSVLLSAAYLEEAKYSHLQAINSVELVRVQLARVLGLNEQTAPMSLQVVGEIPLMQPPATIDLKQISLQTPDYANAIAQEKNAEAGLTIARSGFFPSLGVYASTGNSSNRWFPENNAWSVGANLSFPLFNGGQNFYATRAAGESLRSSRLNLQSASGIVAQKIRQAHSAYLEAVQKVEVDKAFVEALDVRAKIAREKYNNSLLSFDDWDVIETDLINRQKNYLQSQRDRTLAEAAWEQAQGKGVLQ